MVRRPVPGQLSLFGVAATDPKPEDLSGLLAGPGTLRRMGGTAQVGVVVDAAWRVHVLVAEFARRELPSGWEPVPEGFAVRTAYTTRLLSLALAWSDGGGPGGEVAGKRPPPGLHLAGHALRLWVAAAGAATPEGFLLGLAAADEAMWPAVGSALHAAGLGAALVLPGGAGGLSGGGAGGLSGGGGRGRAAERVASGPAYRVTGRRRLARLAELVGDRPASAPSEVWPGFAPDSGVMSL